MSVHLQASTLQGVGPPLSHVILISHVALCIHLDLLSKRISSPITPMIDPIWKFLPGWRMSPLTLECEEVPFLSELLLELLNQEDRVMRCHTSRVMKCNQILQGAMPPTHRRKGGMGDWEVPLHLIILITSLLHNQRVLHRFLCFPPPFINLGARFILRGEGCKTPCYGSPNYPQITFIRGLIVH
jgi:hypothetical protein